MKILDGTQLAGTERRLKPLRCTRASPAPGQALVVLDPQALLVPKVLLCEDAFAQERSLTERILAMISPGEVWLADRNFCTTALLFGLVEGQADFVIRQHRQSLHITALGEPVAKGRTPTGSVNEQAMTLQGPAGTTMALRRISVALDQPTRDGDTQIHLLTALPDTVLDAAQVAELYRRRWTLETAFQELAATLDGELDTLAYPKAALFAFCLALIAYNILAVVKAALRAEHGEDPVQRTVSGYYLADEIAGTYRGLEIAIDDTDWRVFEHASVPEFADLLRQIARHARLPRYKKHPRGPKKPYPPRTQVPGNRVATARLLAGKEAA